MTAEALGWLARVFGILGQVELLGIASFLLLVGPQAELESWRGRWLRILPWAAALLVAGLLLQGLAQMLILIGEDLSRLSSERVQSYLQKTSGGRMLVLRTGLAVACALVAVWFAAGFRRGLTGYLLLAVLTALSGSLAGHAAASENAKWLIPQHAIHVLCAGIWAGALPLWISMTRFAAAQPGTWDGVVVTLQRFSYLALSCVVLIVLSGLGMSWEFIENEGDVLGSPYGALVMFKVILLACVAFLANRLRCFDLPTLTTRPDESAFRAAARRASLEWSCALAIIALAAALVQTTPAIHDQPYWWLPWRVSVDGAREIRSIYPYVTVGMLLALTGLAYAFVRRADGRAHAFSGVGLAGAGLATTLWGISVPAYPDSFRRAEVPYITVSVTHGKELFETHCTSCHGPGGLGDGPAGGALPRPPADLSEPHTALHTAGDMYWWFSHGIPDGGMPGFADKLEDQDLWDLVNFLQTFSQGYEGRIISETVIAKAPWLGAPNFYYFTPEGMTELSVARENVCVLLVFYSGAEEFSRERLHQLSRAAKRLGQEHLMVLAITADGRSLAPIQGLRFADEDAEVIWPAYALLTRSFQDRGDPDRLDFPRPHVEMLIDKYGYIRARWIPEENPEAWADLDGLIRQVNQLWNEPKILEPPDEHVH